MKIELTPDEYFREGKYFSKRFDRERTVLKQHFRTESSSISAPMSR